MKLHRLTAFISLLTLSIGISQAGTLAYFNTQSGKFGTLDVTTGAVSVLGTESPLQAGLGAVGGNLYGADYPGVAVNQIDTSNGAPTPVGNGTVSYAAVGSTLSTLYGLDFPGGTNFNLYSIDPATGAQTTVGNLGIVGFNGSGGFSTGSSTLYFAYDGVSHGNALLYSVDTSTGAATLIGDTGVQTITALGTVNGSLYGANRTGGVDHIFTLDTTSGAAGSQVAIAGLPNDLLFGFVSTGLVGAPEPSTWLLLAGGFALIAGPLKRRMR